MAWWFGLLSAGSLGVAAWGFSPTNCSVSVEANRAFSLHTDMDTFRQLLVRTKATEAILEHSGMELMDETTESVDIDLSNDSRPLRNFLRGKSKANVSATKHLKVKLNDPQISTTDLSLTQECKIGPKNIHVTTSADGPSGDLKSYSTTLKAVKGEQGTDVVLTIEMTVEVKVCSLFESQARSRVQQAANKSLEDQEEALRSLAEDPVSGPSVGLVRAGR